MKDPIKLANDVNAGKFKSVKKSILPFFTQSLDEDGNPYYIGDPEKRIQVREETLDFDFCNNAVAKIKGTGDTSGLAPLTIINFTEKTIQDEKVFHGKMIGNGNHTAQIAVDCNITEVEQIHLDFDEHFDSVLSNVYAFLNQLNIVFCERRGVTRGDVAKQAYQIMNENVAKGKEHKLTDEQFTKLKKQFPEIDKQIVGLWESHHPTHGSRATSNVKKYSKKEIDAIQATYEADAEYDGFLVLRPRTMKSWDHTGVAEVFRKVRTRFPKDSKDKKVLVIFYCSGAEEREWFLREDMALKDRILKEYRENGEYYDIEIKVKFLQHTE